LRKSIFNKELQLLRGSIVVQGPSVCFIHSLKIIDRKVDLTSPVVHRFPVELVRIQDNGSVTLSNVDRDLDMKALSTLLTIQKSMIDGNYQEFMTNISSLMMSCANCGKPLTMATSIADGMGQTCRNKNVKVVQSVGLSITEIKSHEKTTTDLSDESRGIQVFDSASMNEDYLIQVQSKGLSMVSRSDRFVESYAIRTAPDTINALRELMSWSRDKTIHAIIDLDNALNRKKIFGHDDDRLSGMMSLAETLNLEIPALVRLVSAVKSRTLQKSVSDAFMSSSQYSDDDDEDTEDEETEDDQVDDGNNTSSQRSKH
jgi:Zn finger protein HypA/HybF involved in hydrogenase expression